MATTASTRSARTRDGTSASITSADVVAVADVDEDPRDAPPVNDDDDDDEDATGLMVVRRIRASRSSRIWNEASMFGVRLTCAVRRA